MNNFNKFALNLSNANGMAELKVNEKIYNVRLDSLTHSADDVRFEGEVMTEAYDQYGRTALMDMLKEKYGIAIKTSGHSTPYYPRIPVNPTYGITVTRNPDLRYHIDKVIFNNPATIIIWKDGTKTVVKCQEGETFDEEKGLAMAISKRALGDKGNFNEVFKEYVKNEPEKKEEPNADNHDKEGKWIVNALPGYMLTKRIECSVCGNGYITIDPDEYINDHRYCPCCSAKMSGVEEKK